jgi:hypothetical protein
VDTQSFQGRHGRAYLFNNVVNVTLGPKEDRLLITGLHSVCDIYCTCCQSVLGWKYVSAALPLPVSVPTRSLACAAAFEPTAQTPFLEMQVAASRVFSRGGLRVWRQEQAFEESQKYKEGKFIIEKAKMTKVRPGELFGRFEVRHGSILSRGLCDGRRKGAGDPIRVARSCCTYSASATWRATLSTLFHSAPSCTPTAPNRRRLRVVVAYT